MARKAPQFPKLTTARWTWNLYVICNRRPVNVTLDWPDSEAWPVQAEQGTTVICLSRAVITSLVREPGSGTPAAFSGEPMALEFEGYLGTLRTTGFIGMTVSYYKKKN
jgi:hypothetical protein